MLRARVATVMNLNRLWLWVVAQAFLDLRAAHATTTYTLKSYVGRSKQRHVEADRADAKAWLLGGCMVGHISIADELGIDRRMIAAKVAEIEARR